MELARQMTEISREIRRQVGVLLDRKGRVDYVLLGDHSRIWLPDLPPRRAGEERLRGLRYAHTCLGQDGISPDDATDLIRLRFDLVLAVECDEQGLPGRAHLAHLRPGGRDGRAIEILDPVSFHDLRVDPDELARRLEEEMDRLGAGKTRRTTAQGLILAMVSSGPRDLEGETLAEMKELAGTLNHAILDTFIVRRHHPHPKYLLGRGKLQDLMMLALRLDVSTILWAQDLTPAQYAALSEITGLTIVDRTQLILDIFARHAVSRAGQLQVETARLKYLLPRLVVKHTAMSRLTGGIGARGPGETKWEESRRHTKERLRRLEREIESLGKRRSILRRRRQEKRIPVLSIVGYTNAGKSTLLNTLTRSNVRTENRLFATLDPTSKRLRLPREREVIITDTVGFIRDLPPDLIAAFMATLEELEHANLLLEVIDVSNPHFPSQMEAVDDILRQLGYDRIPRVLVFNKIDRVESALVQQTLAAYGGVAISALEEKTLGPLLEAIEARIARPAEISHAVLPG